MRIVVATSSYPGTESDASGHFVRAHARRLARGAGAEVTVIAPGARGEVDVEAVGSDGISGTKVTQVQGISIRVSSTVNCL